MAHPKVPELCTNVQNIPAWGRPVDENDVKLRPSQLVQELTSKSTRSIRPSIPHIIEFLNLEDNSSQVVSTVPINRPLFEPNPSAILFDEYIPFNTHFAKLSLRNNDTVARRIKIQPPDSPFFKVKKCSNSDKDGKIASGMEITYQIEFLPQERKEYSLDLVCSSEREKFLVPIRARGTYAALSFPDEINFGLCPVKIKCSKVMTVHNIGTRGAKFVLTTQTPFKINPQTTYLDIGAAIQIEVEFNPRHTREREGELEIRDDSGRCSYVRLHGEVTNLEVYLSHPIVEPAPAYITLCSRKKIKICNGSDHPVEFSWKAYAGEKNEQSERERLLAELQRMEVAEMDDLHVSGPEIDAEHVDAIGILQRKYKNLKKAVLDDPMQFLDDCFSLDPPAGKIWAHSETEITATFNPHTAAFYSCTAFLDVSGRDTRLQLQIRGQGIGPKASILYDDLFDFGDVFINDPQTHDFGIQNLGEIPAEFELIDIPLPTGVTITFEPSNGVLAINDTCKVFLTFCSAVLGEISVNFNFKLKGSDDLLRVRSRAHVIPPMFQFDIERIDFGIVSFAFLQTKFVTISNTSRISMEYQLRIPQDGLYKHKEFLLTPSDGILEPFGKQEIRIDFTSVNVKFYDYFLVVSVKGVGSDLLNVPVTAQCFVPEVLVVRSELMYGECYLRYSHYQTLSLTNTSLTVPSKYEFVEQDDHSKVVATFVPDETQGIIPPNTTKDIQVGLICEKLGSIRLPMHVRVVGSVDLPLGITLNAHGKGPVVEINEESIDYGPCTCLVDHERSITITNKSLIPASFKTFIRNARSKFTVDKKDCTLAPDEKIELIVSANLDDTIVFKEQLHILVMEGANILIPISARGIGTTMWAPSDMSMIDFKYQMTHRQCEWSCTLENKGKRGQILTWINKTIKQAQLEIQQKVKALQKLNSKSQQNENDGPQPVFTVFPTTIELKPRTACTFYFRGFSMNSGIIQEELICETRIGQEKNPKLAFTTKISAIFINPKMEISQMNGMSFSYIHQRDIEMETQIKPLLFKNICQLPLNFVLKTQIPFSVDMWEALLEPNESIELNVEFYPGYKDDHISRIINSKLFINYSGHPQKDSIDLKGEISFPNLEFEYSKIDFGSILNDTQKSLFIKLTNISKVITEYHWIFIEDEKESRALATIKRPYIPINQVFDILPIRGELKPGETESVEFIFYGHANRKFKSIVACEVQGGPEYELVLSGEASSVSYRLDRPYIDFGPVVYNKAEDREFSILNLGKVAFSFTISLDKLTRPGIAEVSPISGRIFANDKQRISVRLRPGIPETMVETLWLEVAHFQPVEFKMYCHGIFASLSANLPRGNHPSCSIHGIQPKWRDLVKMAKDNFKNPRLDVYPPSLASCETTTLGLTRPNSRAPQPIRGANANGGMNSAVTTDRGGVSSRMTGRTTNRLTERNSTTARSNVKALNVSPSRETFDPIARMGSVDELDVDTEACRILFVQYLLTAKPEVQLVVEEELPETKAVTVPILSISKTVTADAGSSKKIKKVQNEEIEDAGNKTVPVDEFILSQYVLDFGNVVSGTHRVKKFLLTNTGQVPTSFQIDKNMALARGFSIEPERVVRLPEKKSIEFTVTFQARKNGRHGAHGVNILLEMKNGPSSLLTLKANVTIPDVMISQETLDFGQLLVGRSHVIHTQFQNTCPVSVEWSLKKPIGSTRDLNYFKMDPQAGVLHPGTRCNIRVEFIPLEGRLYHVKIPVKINSNPKTKSISCSGEGTELRVSFSPPMAELGPVLPYSTPIETIITMKNESDYPVEVYSLDFDTTYKEEEEMLRSAGGYSDDDFLRLPLRLPGDVLTPEILHLNEPTDVEVSAVVQQSRREKQEANDYIIIGPPCCGKTTQAKLLSEKENIPVWSIEQAVVDVSTEESPLGKTIRKALGLAPIQYDLPPPVAPPVDENESHDKKKKKKEEEQEVPIEPLPPVIEEPVVFTWELLRDVMDSRLNKVDMVYGSILDGLENPYLSPLETYNAIALALEGATILHFSFTEDMYESLLSEMIKTTEDSLRQLTSTKQESNNDTLGVLDEDQVQAETPPQPVCDTSALDHLLERLHSYLENQTFEKYMQGLPSLMQGIRDNLLTIRPEPSPDTIEELDTDRSNNSFEDAAQEMTTTASDASIQPQVLESEGEVPPPETPPIPPKIPRVLVLNEIHFQEYGPPLSMHSSMHAAIERFARELLSANLQVPPPVSYQLVKKPHYRLTRKQIAKFEIGAEKMRWILPPKGESTFLVLFSSNDVGAFDNTLGFEIVGGRREVSLFCRATCAVPTINNDPRNVFMSRAKSKSDLGIVQKKYVQSKSQYEFGALLLGKDPSLRLESPGSDLYRGAKLTNAEIFRISNTSKYTCQLDFSFEKNNEQPVFFVEPETAELQENETTEVIVWAFPAERGLVEDSLVCCVSDNPEPVVFPISCLGCVPLLELVGIPGEPSDRVIDFERLLLCRHEEKQFTMVNKSEIPVAWKLALDGCPEEFDFAPKEGVLKSGQKAIVTVAFTAGTEGVFNFPVNVEYSDAENGFRPNYVEKLAIKAEAYKIDVCSFEESNADQERMNGVLDFGLLRVGDTLTKIFQLRNRGKYDIKVLLSIKRNKELLQIKPTEAVLAPGKVQPIEVSFMSTSEIYLRDCKDIKCVILECLTEEIYNEFPVLVHARSVFSKFRLQPARGLSFGSMRFNEEKKTKRLELRNDGEYPFKFRVIPSTEQEVIFDVESKPLQIGQFTIIPNAGTLEPGCIIPFDVIFQPLGAAVYRETIRIEISGRDPMNETETNALIYELNGESCYPGINIHDMESIFEEQAVIRTFGLDSNQELHPRNQAIFAQVEKLFDFGAIIVSKNVVERFKISNPTKVLACVKFQVKEVEDQSIFTVQPSSWDIPPHEHRYVNVHFKPTGMRMYHGVFRASVDDGADPTSSVLQFDIRGEGTMPCVTIEKPTYRDVSGILSLDFGRVRLGKSKEMEIIIRNDGIVPANVLFNMSNNSNFIFNEINNLIHFEPKIKKYLKIIFKPIKINEEIIEINLKLNVENNPFEETIVKLIGQGYKNLIFLNHLKKDDNLIFDDINLNLIKNDEKDFEIKNESMDCIRFTWPQHSNLKFIPSIGHILPKTSKRIQGIFQPFQNTPIILNEKIIIQIQKIKKELIDWDDSMKIGTNDELISINEPSYEIDGILTPINLEIHGVADFFQYECDINSILFKKTFLFQRCGYKFNIKNKSKIQMEFTWIWMNQSISNENPFQILPETGIISGTNQMEFLVLFIPMEINNFNFKLSCHMKDGTQHDISVEGISLRPVCHIDLEQSDYPGRRHLNLLGPNGELGPLDPSIRVVEMESLGIRVRNTKRFYVINPTNISYEFTWIPKGNGNPAFRCVTPKGFILAGKRCEMVFEFTPQDIKMEEIFYFFKIEHFLIEELFLFVGKINEPRIYFERGNINFNTLLIHSKTIQEIYLINDEDIPFHYFFEKNLNEKLILIVSPLSGIIPPHGRCIINIEFSPNEEKNYNFNIFCNIKKKPKKLSLNIKGEGYAIHDSIILQDNNQFIQSIEPNSIQWIDFGTVRLHEIEKKIIIISNTGKFNFEFNFILNLNPMIKIEPSHGTVRKNDKIKCFLIFSPTIETTIDMVQLVCTIAGSREYIFHLRGNSIPPAVDFSFLEYDFGPCFIAEPDGLPIFEKIILRVLNQDNEMDINIDSTIEKKSHLKVEIQPIVLGPHESIEIPIVFIARREGFYEEIIPFLINGTTCINVTIRGEGIYPKIELIGNSLIHFGTLKVGETISRFLKLINRSKKKINFNILNNNNNIIINPKDEIELKIKEIIEIELKFQPTRRIQFFQDDFYMNIYGKNKKLFTCTGLCQGMDVQLETETLNFGTVVYGSQLIRKILLQNRGDLIAKFSWDLKYFKNDFKINPINGIILPNQDKIFEIIFLPEKINQDIRHEKFLCSIEDGDDIFLTLTGSCVEFMESTIKELIFESKVRKELIKEIIIENKTNKTWNLIPILNGIHWNCIETINIPSNTKGILNIHYFPLFMTENLLKKHQGSIFIPIPDGTAIKYNFIGIANEPESIENIKIELNAKKSLVLKLPIKNWLNEIQLFHVFIENNNKSTFLQGADTISIPSNAQREYGLKIYAYLEGMNEFQVRFTNKESGEYVFYTIQLQVTPPGIIDTLVFHAPVRQSVKKLITIENPFPESTIIQFDEMKWWQCTCPSIRVRRLGELTGRAEGTFEVEYRPLIHGDPLEVDLTIWCHELGEYNYKLQLTTSPPGIEGILYFNVPLGGSQNQIFRFQSFVNKSCEYRCIVNQPTYFHLPPSVKVDGSDWDGIEGNVTIKFEPEIVGEIRDTLILMSEHGGEYKCTLQGTSVPPLPQGPYLINQSKEIEFKNVFNSLKEFNFSIDNPGFSINLKQITIPPKSTKLILIKLEDTTKLITGKLLITCPSLPDLPPWIYYLEGDINENKK